MTTQVTTIGTVGTMGPARRPSLEELVDRLIAAMFPQEEETTETVARSVHDARRLRQTGDLDGAAGGLRRCGHGEGDGAAEPLGARRVARSGEAQVRRKGAGAVQPGQG